ncbi:Ferredoxin-dependent glutamate synthase [Bacillus cereus]|nr:Ferredoxin-dependent glutamate synthase [Bacillus cereus]
MFGASATSYGAIGENYILASGFGAKMAGGSWINTGEGGVIPEHLHTGANIVAQIGPGLFGYRDEDGNFSMEKFMEKAKESNIKAKLNFKPVPRFYAPPVNLPVFHLLF